MLVTVTDFLGTDYVACSAARASICPISRTIIIARWPDSRWNRGVGRLRRAHTAEAPAEVDRRGSAVTDDDVVRHPVHLGHDGQPKGVVQTHASTLQVAADWVAMTGLPPTTAT